MSDLTAQEQANVRTALKHLRLRCGGWDALSKALRFKKKTLAHAVRPHGTVTASVAFRIARLAGVSIDELLAGAYPAPGTCPYCGHVKVDET